MICVVARRGDGPSQAPRLAWSFYLAMPRELEWQLMLICRLDPAKQTHPTKFASSRTPYLTCQGGAELHLGPQNAGSRSSNYPAVDPSKTEAGRQL